MPSNCPPAQVSGRNGWLRPPAVPTPWGAFIGSWLPTSCGQGIHHIYERLKPNKALPDTQGMGIAVVDGHESHTSLPATWLRLPEANPASGDRRFAFRFITRQLTLMLLPGAPGSREPIRLLLDHEPQLPGENEVAAAMRLLERVIHSYPRAFDLVLADALYATAPFFNFPIARHKHARVVLKDERRHLCQDAAGLFETLRRNRVGAGRANVCGGIFPTCSPGPM
jgi:hypothetical protein